MALLDLCAETPDLSAFAAPGEADGNCGLAVDIFLDFARHLLPEARSDEVYFVAPSRWRKARLETRVVIACAAALFPTSWMTTWSPRRAAASSVATTGLSGSGSV